MVGFAFSETDEAASEITRLFDFIWPTAVALWNLRWQVDGFLTAVPGATHEDVASRFVVGSGINGADIRAMSINTSWDDQKTRFAEFVLTNIFAIYESWARSLLRAVHVTSLKDQDLYREGDGSSTGLAAFLSKVNSTPSAVMQSAFQNSFLGHKKVFVAQQSGMLKCYKYFKELRNCHIHNGGVADQRLVDAFLDFTPISSPSAMKTKETIEHFPATLGTRTPLSLRGTVGFCDIVLRLMVTVDAQLSGSKAAEESALDRMHKGAGKYLLTLNRNSAVAHRQIGKICRNGNLPKPLVPEDVRQLLLQHRLVGR